MNKYFLILILICSASIEMIGQNLICQVDFVDQIEDPRIMIEFEDGETINLKTSVTENQVRSIEFFGDAKFVLILFETKSNSSYIINSAFKLHNEWIQDYQDRIYFKPNTGISCSEITSMKIVDEQTIRVVYETTIFDDYHEIETNLHLGKYSLFEENTKMHYDSRFGIVSQSPRKDYSKM